MPLRHYRVPLEQIKDPDLRAAFLSVDKSVASIFQHFGALVQADEGPGYLRVGKPVVLEDTITAPNVKRKYGRRGQLARTGDSIFLKVLTDGEDTNWSEVATVGSGGGGAFAAPTAFVTLSPQAGSGIFYMRSDAAPALSQDIAPTWTNAHTWSPSVGTRLPMRVVGASGQTANLIVADDFDGMRLLELDPEGKLGIHDNPDAMLTVRMFSEAGSELHDALYWPSDGTGRGFYNAGAVNPNGDFTIDLWIRVDTDSDTTVWQNLFVIGTNLSGAGANTACLGAVFIGQASGAFIAGEVGYLVSAAGSTLFSIDSMNVDIRDGAWHHIAVVHKKTGATSHDATLFIDGILRSNGTGTGATPVWNNVYDYQIGSRVNTANNSAQGVAFAGIKVRTGAQYTTGGTPGDQVFTPPLPSAIPTADLVDIDFDEGSGIPVDDVDPLGISRTHAPVNDPTWSEDTIALGSVPVAELQRWKDIDGTILTRVDEFGRLGVGVDPTARVHIRDVTTPQLRLDYSATEYLSVSVAGTGVVSYDITTAGAPEHRFEEPLTITSPTAPQLKLRFDATGTTDVLFSVSSSGDLTITPDGTDVNIVGDLTVDDIRSTTGNDSWQFISNKNATIGSLDAFDIEVMGNPGAAGSYFRLFSDLNGADLMLLSAANLRLETISYDDTLHFVAAADSATGGLDLGFNGRIDSQVLDVPGAASIDCRPTGGLTASGDRYYFRCVFPDGSGGFYFKANGTFEFNGGGTFGGLVNVAGNTDQAFGINFVPTVTAGTSYFGVANLSVAGYFSSRKEVGGTVRAQVGGLFETYYNSPGAVAETDHWGGWFRPIATAFGGTSTWTLTQAGGWKVFGLTVLKNLGTITNWYGGYVSNSVSSAPSSGMSITNAYGLYLEEQTRATAINNGIFLANATAGRKLISMRDQNVWLGSDSAGQMALNATTFNLVFYDDEIVSYDDDLVTY